MLLLHMFCLFLVHFLIGSFAAANQITVPENCFTSVRSQQSLPGGAAHVCASLQNCTTLCNNNSDCLAAEYREELGSGALANDNCWLYASVPRLTNQNAADDSCRWTMCFKVDVVVVPYTCIENSILKGKEYMDCVVENLESCQDLCNDPNNNWCVGISYIVHSLSDAQSNCRLFRRFSRRIRDTDYRSCLKGIPSKPKEIYVVETAKRKLELSNYEPETAEAITNVINAVSLLDQQHSRGHTSFLITGSTGSGKTTLSVALCDYFVHNMATYSNAEIRRFLRPEIPSVDAFIEAIERSQIIIIDEFLYWTKDPIGEEMLGYLMERITPEPDNEQTVSRLTIFIGYEDGYKAMTKFNAGWERRLAEVIQVVPKPAVVAKAVLHQLQVLNISFNTSADSLSQINIFANLSRKYGFGIVNMIWVQALSEFRLHQNYSLQLEDFEEILQTVQNHRGIELLIRRLQRSKDETGDENNVDYSLRITNHV